MIDKDKCFFKELIMKKGIFFASILITGILAASCTLTPALVVGGIIAETGAIATIGTMIGPKEEYLENTEKYQELKEYSFDKNSNTG